MNPMTRRLIHWAPRLLAIVLAAFLGLFALDVFDHSEGFGQTTAALLVHLIPTWLVLLGLAVSWRREWLGAILFAGLGVVYVALFQGRFPWMTYVVIAGPLFLTGALFLISWRLRAGGRPEPDRPAA
jgi:hypothetical protein